MDVNKNNSFIAIFKGVTIQFLMKNVEVKVRHFKTNLKDDDIVTPCITLYQIKENLISNAYQQK